MKSAEYVSKKIEEWKKAGNPLMWVCWHVALLCVGWAYVFGARGEPCTPANRRAYFRSKGVAHPTIASKCQVIRADNPKSDCNGCKWYPDKKRTRIFDCRGFVYWVLLVVCGFKLQGAGATSQWDTAKNWAAKGEIKTRPKDRLVCVFCHNKKKKNMSHVAFAYGDEVIECRVGVQHSKTVRSDFTHWALPACFAEGYSPPEEKPKEESKVSDPVLKKGASGSKVKELQKLLIDKGYSCGSKGADGKYGNDTLAAVKAFQKAQGLTADGVVGQDTWKALKTAEKPQGQLYRVIIPGQTEKAADALINAHKGAYKEKEG